MASEYERNPVNNSALGKDFEENVAIYSVLTQLQNEQHAIAIEYRQAPAKFDDVVLRVQKGNNFEYYCRQSKYRDSSKDPDACLTWNDLLKSKKTPRGISTPFGIPWYYECFVAAQKNSIPLERVKELGFMTNYGLVRHGEHSKNDNLETLAKYLIYSNAKEKKCLITSDELKWYFKEWSDTTTWRPPCSSDQKSYKFTEEAINAIFKGTQAGYREAGKVVDLGSYKKFLELLVFHVSMPNLESLKETNRNILKVFLPFHKNIINSEYGNVQKKLMLLFGKNTSDFKMAPVENTSNKEYPYHACWATRESLRLHLERAMNLFFEKTNYLERTERTVDSFYSTGVSANYDPKLPRKSSDWEILLSEILETSKKWAERYAMTVANIYNADSNATVITLKVYKVIQEKKLDGRTEIKELHDRNGVQNLFKYFEELDKEVHDNRELINGEKFICIIPISPFFTPSDERRTIQVDLSERLISFTSLRKLMLFIIITRQPINLEGEQKTDFNRFKDELLRWQDMSEEYKKHLFEKTLYLDGNKKTSLTALGFERKTAEQTEHKIGEWLHPRALAELIIHDKERPLNLGLTNKDKSIENGYIERQIQLPLVRTDSLKKNNLPFTCNENDFNTAGFHYLLCPVHSQQHKNECLLVKARNNTNILDLKDFFVRSKDSDYTIHEMQLLENVNFGTGSIDNKLLIVVDYPGKGKSCLLTRLSNRFLEESFDKPLNRLLLRVNLREIKDWEKQSSEIEFLLNQSKTSREIFLTDNNACLTAAIITGKCIYEPPSVFVFLDGYDEISERQRITTLKVVENLTKMKGIKRIILSSRHEANLEGELEQRFRQFSLHLKNFDRKDQIYYLTKRWTSKVMEKPEMMKESVGKIEQFAEAIVNFAKEALEDENKDETFLSIPLQCWVFSECFYQQLVNYLMSDGETIPLFDKEGFEILRLYDRFFEAKMDVLLQDKGNIPPHEDNETLSFLRNDIEDGYLRSLERLSVFHMIGEKDDAECVCRLSWENYKSGSKSYRGEGPDISEFERDLRRAMKLGVVQGWSGDDKPFSIIEPQDIRFLHRTFAEHFFARYLFRNFTQEKSELFEGTISRRKLIDKSLKIISEKILVTPEFVGVRRFLDRMLAKQVPPAGEQCPFAKEDRSEVLMKWPVIGHERFNELLAKSIILQNATDFEELSFRNHLSASQHFEEDYKKLINQGERKKDLAFILGIGFNKEPFLTSVLLHCIKEYASRQQTSDEEREKLSYSVTLSSLITVMNTEAKIPGEIANSLFHWFYPTTGSPSTANYVFAKWIFILLNVLARLKKGSDYFKSDLIASICKALEFHENYPDFEESICAVVTSRLFAMREKRLAKRYNTPFFEIGLGEFWYENRKKRITDSLFEGICVCLGARTASHPNLLQWLTDYLVEKLSQHTVHADQYLIELYHFRGSLINANNLRHEMGNLLQKINKPLEAIIDSNENFVLENVVRPYAFIGTVRFFMTKSQLSKSTITNLRNVSLEYIVRIQTVLFRIIHLVNLSQVLGLAESTVVARNYIYNISMLWYFLVSDAIISFMSDTGDIRTRGIHGVFFTDIGQKSLIAYAHAICCCQCENDYFRGFGIHFPHDKNYSSDSIVGPFRSLFADKLKFLFNNGKAEIEFIDFLFNGCEFDTEDERELEKSNENRSTTSFRSISYTLEEAESRLRAIYLSKLPCLLFSDVVAEYIPQKLSPAGLDHLIYTLRTLPLIICERNCFYFLEVQFPSVTTNLRMSILDGIMQEDVTYPRIFKCKKRANRIKALQEKLKEATIKAQLTAFSFVY